ncbi:MAG TPA: DUF4112 domain-containing protein [Caulobacteraceae bacterium]|jgi:hypothetical protein
MSTEELLGIRRRVERVGRFSDGLMRIGPFRLGAEAALSWIPVVGEAYGAAAATYLLAQGWRAQVPLRVLATCAGLMFGRTLISAAPVAGPIAADLLALHGVSARMIVKAIDAKIAQPARPARGGWRKRMFTPVAA